MWGVFKGEISMDWYRWHPELYEADTLHLSLAEDGAYRRLIDAYMRLRVPLPDDDRQLARLIGVGLGEWTELAPVLRAFFRQARGTLRHKRCDIELDRQDKDATKRSEKASHAAASRWSRKRRRTKAVHATSNAPSSAPSMPEAMLGDARGEEIRVDKSPPYSPPGGDVVPTNGALYNEAFRVLWESWRPVEMGKGSKKRAGDAWQKLVVDKHLDPRPILQAAGAYCVQCATAGGTKTRHLATWITQCGWLDDYDSGVLRSEDAVIAGHHNAMEQAWSRAYDQGVERVEDHHQSDDEEMEI